MKTFRLLSFLLILVFLFTLFACPPKPPEKKLTDIQQKAKLLTGTWSNATDVTVPDGVDPAILDDLAITFNTDADFNPTIFSSSGASDFFATQTSSTWNLSGTGLNLVTLTNVLPVTQFTILSVSETLLKLQITHPGARITSLNGDYKVTLSR